MKKKLLKYFLIYFCIKLFYTLIYKILTNKRENMILNNIQILCDTNDDNPVQIQTNCTQFNNSQSRTFFNSICDQPTVYF